MKKLIATSQIRGIVLLFTLVVILMTVHADNEIKLITDRINYYNSELHTITVSNNGELTDTVEINLPANWLFISGNDCTNNPPIRCTVVANSSVSFTVQSSDNVSKFTKSSIYVQNSERGYTSNIVYFLRIRDTDIFHTLVEFGRGRGNYFFGTAARNEEKQCRYLPDRTMIELSFLHKIHPIQHYFGLVDSVGTKVNFNCIYPENAITRQHLASTISRFNNHWNITFGINSLTGSWERMGYISMQFEPKDYSIGDIIAVDCTDISYFLEDAGGYISIPNESFNFSFRNHTPFTAVASSDLVVGKGTQEVLVRYTITNEELYVADDVIIEIHPPLHSRFIGVRGELWGSAQDVYRIERSNIPPGSAINIDLIVRFDTSEVTDVNLLNLSEGITARYKTCWEANAYNPLSYTQFIDVAGTIPLNLETDTEIIVLAQNLEEILKIVNTINQTTNLNNQVLQQINIIIEEVNKTTQEIQSNITSVIIPSMNEIITTINNVESLTSEIYHLVDCTNKSDLTICDRLESIQNSVFILEVEIGNRTYELFESLDDTITHRFNLVDSNLSELSSLSADIIYDINDLNYLLSCINNSVDTVCNKLDNLDIFMTQVNNTVSEIKVLTVEINSTTHANAVLLETINLSTNIILNNLDVLNISLETFSKEIQALVDCASHPESPLCKRLINIQDVVGKINRLSNILNTRVINLGVQLYTHSLITKGEFNTIGQELSILKNDIDDVNKLVNCTYDSQDHICNQLYKVNLVVDEINRTTNHALKVLLFLDEIKWGGLTASELFSQLDLTRLELEELLYSAMSMQDFDYETIFLISDAFNMQVLAQEEINKGKYSSAVEKLNTANNLLESASQKILEFKEQEIEIDIERPGIFNEGTFHEWRVEILFIVGLLIVLLFIKIPTKHKG